jgi:FlgD Ig-like domain
LPLRAPTLLVVVLLAATGAAFAISERLKLEPTAITNPKVTETFSPGCRCAHSRAAISFRLRKPGTVSVWVVQPDGTIVAPLVRDEHTSAGVLRFTWDGKSRAGEVAADGSYQVRVRVADVRTIDIPDRMHLDTTPPAARIVSVRPPSLVRSRTERVVVRYRLSERGTPILYANGRRATVGSRVRPRGRLDWYARRNGRPLPPGRYRLTVAATDEAGNRGRPSRPVDVAVRP